ncbi:MAG: PAS domain-containing protein, partial [Desulfovibrionaceae bacterium]
MRRSSASTPPGPKSRSAGVRSGLQRRLDDVEAGLAALAAGQGRPEDAQAALDLLRDLRDRLPDRRPRRPAADQDRAADQRYRSLFDNASDAILIVAPDGRIRDANKAACQQLGYDRAHLLRRQPADLTSPELRPALGGYLQTVLGQGQATFETRFLTAAGRRLPGEVTAKRVEGESGPEILCVIRDTTRRSQAIAAMESQYAFIQTLMETAPAPIFFKDIDGAYLGCNRAFEELMGLPRHEIVGHTVRSIAPPDLAAEYEAHDRELLLHPGRVVYETRVLTDNGSRERHALVNKATYPDASGQVAGIVGIILDITEHK